MAKKKFLMIMLICLSMILAFQSINVDGFFIFPGTETKPVLELTDNIPFSIVLLSGEAEVGFGKGFGDIVVFNNTDISMTLINPSKSSVKLDSLLLDTLFLEEEGYLEDGTIPVIIQLSECAQEKPTAKKARTAISSARSALSTEVRTYKMDLEIICSISADVEPAKLEELANSKHVSKVYLDQKYEIMLNDSTQIIGADSVWNLTEGNNSINGTGVVIAILDTGLNFEHLDFQDKNILAKSFVPGESVDDYHLKGHGTHCAGIATGTGAASDGKFTGVAPGADLVVGKVMNNQGLGMTSWIISGIEWAMNTSSSEEPADGGYFMKPAEYLPPEKADIISMSLGGSGTDGNDPLSLAVDAAVDSGMVVVVAAGNAGANNPLSISTPGVARKVITVGASTKTDDVAYFSSMGPTIDGRLKPEVVAPGVNICAAKAGTESSSVCGNDAYRALDGTSMATPHVAGSAALLLQKHPDWTPEDVKSALVLTAVDLNKSVFVQGSGRIDVYRAINTPVLTEPAVLNMGFVENTSNDIESVFYGYLEIGVGEEKYHVPITIMNIEYLSGEWAKVNESSFNISSGENHTVLVTVNNTVSSEITIKNIFDTELEVELGFSEIAALSSVFVGVVREDGNLSKPVYAVLYNHNNFEGLIVWQSYGTDKYNYTFFIPPGNYTLHVLGDADDFDLYYVLGESFELGEEESKNFLYNLGDVPKINVPLQSKDEIDLDVYRYEYLVVCNYPTEPKRIRLLNVVWGLGETMDGSIYVSPTTCANRSIQIQARGSPTRGHFEEWVPGADLYTDLSGKEWTWRWENRDISDEDYLLAWNVIGDVTEDITLAFDLDKTSTFKEYYNFAGYAPFTQNYHPQHFMSRIVFWLAPDWFESWSFWKRINPPLERTVYLMGENWLYRGYTMVVYPNSRTQSNQLQFEYPMPYGAPINDPHAIRISSASPIHREHYFGTAPFQLPYFVNNIIGSQIEISTNAPAMSGYDNSTFSLKDYNSITNPIVEIHRNETLVFPITTQYQPHLMWRYGIVNTPSFNPADIALPKFSGYGNYKVNFTLPLKYSVYNVVNTYAEINFNESGADVNPPQPTRFWVDPSFDYNVAIPVEVEFAEELDSAEMHYKTDLTNWIPMNISNNGTQINGSINITDGASRNISLKIHASDLAGNDITYMIEPVSVLYREIEFNFNSNQTIAYPGDTILFNGTVRLVNDTIQYPLDQYFSGIRLKYFVNGDYVDFDRTDFQENLNTIDLRMPSYQMCMGCFEKVFMIPENFEDAQINFTVLFEGSGPYKPASETILVDVVQPFKLNLTENEKTVTVGTTAMFEFSLKNNIETSDEYLVETNSNVSWTVNLSSQSFGLVPEEEMQITVNVIPSGISQKTTGEINITINSIKTGYSRTITFLVNAEPQQTNGGSTSGSSGGTIPPSTITQTTSGTSVFYNVVEGETIYLEPTWRMDMAVSSITFSENADELKVSIAKAEPTIQPDGNVYMTFKINTDARVSDATISFRVAKSWLERTEISADSIRLAREDGTRLTTFDTRIVREDAEYFYFESQVDHFSTFSIISVEQPRLAGFFDILQKIDMYYGRQISFSDLVSAISTYFSR